jgi:hypothetical protein
VLSARAGYHHFKKTDIVLLTDDVENPRAHPTRKNMLGAMRWLVQEAQPDDSLFFHCASPRAALPTRG